MSLKLLIKKQKIIIDDHKRGNQEIKNWDNTANDVHIDKSTNYPINGKKQNLRLRIPINSDEPVKITNVKGGQQNEIPKKLLKEIKQAFENKATREKFITEVLDILENYETILNSEEHVRQILTRLSRHFNLEWKAEIITVYLQDALQSYTQTYVDESNRKFYISIDRDKIMVGEKVN